jgi:hypothetical protein
MFDILKYVTDMTEKYDSEPRLAFRSNNPMGTEAGTIPIEFDELSPQEQEYYQNPPFSTHSDFLGAKGGSAQLVQPGPGYKPGGLVEPGVMNYGKEDKLGKNISYIKEAKHYNYKKPVYRFSITFPPGMKKNEVNMVREATPKNLKMMKKLRNKLQGEIDTFYGPNRITTEDVLKLRDKHPTLTNKQIAEKLKGKIGARGHPFTESSVKKATIDAGKKGKYGKLTSLGRTLEQLKEEAIKLPLGKKYLDDYNKTKNKDEALKVFRDRIKTGLHRHFTADPAKAATWRAKWAKTEKGALSIKKSLEKQSALRTAVYGNFNPGRDPEHRLFHALWRSSQQAGSRWKLISKKPDKWTRETSRGAKFLDTKNKKPITLDGLKKYMDTTPDVGSYKVALKPFKEKAALQKYLVNYKGKEYKLGNLLNERLWTGDDWKYFSEGTSEIVVNHPDKVKDNWWKGEVAYKDANMRLNDLERTFASQMRRADTDIDRQKVLKKNLAKDIKRLGPITYKGPHGAFGTKPTPSAVIKSMVKPMYKKTGDKALSRTLNTLVKQIGCGGRLASQGGGDVDCFALGKEKIKTNQIKTPGEKANFSKLAKIAGGAKKLGAWLFGPVEMGTLPLFLAGEGLYDQYANKRDLRKALERDGEMSEDKIEEIVATYGQESADLGDVGLEDWAIEQRDTTPFKESLAEIDISMPQMRQDLNRTIEYERALQDQEYQKQLKEAQRERYDPNLPMMAGGGIATLHPRRPGALPPPSGPDSQGLAYLNNYATKRTE